MPADNSQHRPTQGKRTKTGGPKLTIANLKTTTCESPGEYF
ncbi:hypothetical protein [Marinobacter sp. M3C]|jgi:hypothetical protein|nr:hypothetical protein [Marinobacter sp. M3C]